MKDALNKTAVFEEPGQRVNGKRAALEDRVAKRRIVLDRTSEFYIVLDRVGQRAARAARGRRPDPVAAIRPPRAKFGKASRKLRKASQKASRSLSRSLPRGFRMASQRLLKAV